MHFTNDILKLQISVFHRILIVRNHCLFAIPTYLQECKLYVVANYSMYMEMNLLNTKILLTMI